MCCHFVGPNYVAMDKKGRRHVLDCLSALATLAEVNCEFGHGRKAVESIAENAENFFEIAIWYNRRNIANKILQIYEKSLNVCYEDKKLKFAFGRTVLRKSLRKIFRILDDEQVKWPYQRRKITRLLKL